jgi:hypothetical protein
MNGKVQKLLMNGNGRRGAVCGSETVTTTNHRTNCTDHQFLWNILLKDQDMGPGGHSLDIRSRAGQSRNDFEPRFANALQISWRVDSPCITAFPFHFDVLLPIFVNLEGRVTISVRRSASLLPKFVLDCFSPLFLPGPALINPKRD